MRTFITKLCRDERGVSAIEYAILASIIVVAVVSVGTILQSSTSGLPSIFTKLMQTITNNT